MDRDGQACIADFGLLRMVCDETGIESSLSYAQGGTIRWMSPELLDPERFGFDDSRPRIGSDCYALGMVIYEVFSGQKPFAQCREPAVIRKVIDGERPERPRGAAGVWFVDDVWEVVKRCWEARPENRPDVKTVLQCLERVPERLLPPSPLKGDDGGSDTTDADDQSHYFTASDISGAFPRFTGPGPSGSSHNSPKNRTGQPSTPGSRTNRQPRVGVLTTHGELVEWYW